MKVLFISLGTFDNLNGSSVHIDILKRFAEEHDVYLVCKNEKTKTSFKLEYGIHALRVHTGVLKKVGLFQKGVSTVLVENQFKNAIEKYLSNIKFDLILYTTPPVTFANVIKYIKGKDNALCYLMLKDIFPQNAVDIGILSKTGIKGIAYKYFRHKEKMLYKYTDYFGCMSPANCNYLIKNNPEINVEKVEVCPNISVIEDVSVDLNTRYEVRKRNNLPIDKKIFIYGGNLGKPQGIPFLLECLEKAKNEEVFFLIIGTGTEFNRIESFLKTKNLDNCKLLNGLPKNEFEQIVASCDVGMIFLDYRFTIPNFPSRMLSYMKAKVPIIAVTDPNTDVGTTIVNGNFGWWCLSNNSDKFVSIVRTINGLDYKTLKDKGESGFGYLKLHFSPDNAYNVIMKHLKS